MYKKKLNMIPILTTFKIQVTNRKMDKNHGYSGKQLI